MAIDHIHTYLVHPGKASEETREIVGAEVLKKGQPFGLLNEIYKKSDSECDTDISFSQDEHGKQKNPCRDLIINYLKTPTLNRGKLIAERLEKITTHRSGLGLLFLIFGKEGTTLKFVISRFPANSAILAEEDKKTLSVAFLERVFMKSATAYKAVLYADSSLKAGFWSGRAVDKQINSRVVGLSNYWIVDFLASDFLTTSAAGTRRLALALRNAAALTDDLGIKSEIAAAATLAKGLSGKKFTTRQIMQRLNLSPAAQDSVLNELKQPHLADEKFAFDWTEFSEVAAYRAIELDTGATLIADASVFDTVFKRTTVNVPQNRVRYSTEGKVINEKLRKTR